jgi:HD-GYP domain-containing protein (c-di-GMP phosphodiesterase class II)
MTSSRPYRPGMSRQHAIEEIRNGALTQFDPQVVAGFLQVMEESSKVRPISAAPSAGVAAVSGGAGDEHFNPERISQPLT